MNGEPQFILPRTIEHHLATLSKLYAREGERQKQALLVNAKVRVSEQWSHDNWDGIDGHALYLTVPESLYLDVARDRDALQTAIKDDLNKIHNVQREFIEVVFIEMEPPEDDGWRRDSGLLHVGRQHVSVDTSDRIWGASGFRVFLSHKAEVKVEAVRLKEGLARLGASAFVAHEDIHPTREWQEEIVSALTSMEAFVALMTKGFHESDWTDQEVGFALGRDVPIIAVRLDRDPYGFIGRFQALSCGWKDAPREIARLLMKHSRMVDGYISAVKTCANFDAGNEMAELLPTIPALTTEQADRLVTAFNDNVQVRGSYGFNGTYPLKFGPGLASHLARITGRTPTTSGGKLKLL